MSSQGSISALWDLAAGIVGAGLTRGPPSGRINGSLPLKGADVDHGATVVVAVPNARKTALIGCCGIRVVAGVDGRATGEEGHGLGGAPVVLERAEPRGDWFRCRAPQIPGRTEPGAAGRVPNQVVPLAREIAGHVRAGAAGIDQVEGDDRVSDGERTARIVEEAAAGVRGVVSDCAVDQGRGICM